MFGNIRNLNVFQFLTLLIQHERNLYVLLYGTMHIRVQQITGRTIFALVSYINDGQLVLNAHTTHTQQHSIRKKFKSANHENRNDTMSAHKHN